MPVGTFAGPFFAIAVDGFSTVATVPATATTPAVGNIMQAITIQPGWLGVFVYFPVSSMWGVVAGLDPSQFAPALNPAGGANNYAPIDNPNFTTNISLGGVPLSSIFAPYTNPANGANNYAPLASPTFSGTVTAPAFSGAFTGSFSGPTVAVTNGSYAAAGQVGEIVQVGGSGAIPLGPAGSANYVSVVSTTLGAGDWDITGEIAITGALATTAPYIAFGAYMSTAGPNGPPTLPGAAMMAIQIDWQAVNIPMGMAVLNTASPVNLYLIANAWTPNSDAGSLSTSAFIHARRAR